MDVQFNNHDFSIILIDAIIIKKTNPLLLFKNRTNLQHFSNFINSILVNNDFINNKENSEILNINFGIIHIAERCFYIDETEINKTYLSAILSKNKIFSSKNYWLDLIDFKLIKRLERFMKDIKLKNISKYYLI